MMKLLSSSSCLSAVALLSVSPWAFNVVAAEDLLTSFEWELGPPCPSGYDECGMLEYCVHDDGGVGYRQFDDPNSVCSHPGPLVRVQPGKKYLMTLRNNVPSVDPTNIHTHGLHIGGSGNEDDITREVHYENCLGYAWDVPSFHTGGTYWYHAHAHEYTAQQVADGAFGMIIVEDTDDIFQDTGIAGTEKDNIQGFLNNDKALVIALVGGSWSGNGVPFADLNINANEWTRLRVSISEAGAKKKDLQITPSTGVTCETRIISFDGVPRSTIPSEPITDVTLTGASRVDLAVKCSGPVLGDAVVEYGNADAARLVIASDTDGNAVITPFLADGISSWNPFRPTYLEDMSGLPTDGTYSVTMTASQINGEVWDPVNPLLEYQKDQVFEWTLSGTNAHPFHIHLYHMQVVTPGGCSHHEYGEWYDTISSQGSDCTVRFRTNDIGGRCVLHCHVLSHEDNGSMHWIRVNGFPPPSIINPPVEEFFCGGGVPAPTAAPPPTFAPISVDCSSFSNKQDCNAQPTCTWSNRDKVCM